MPDAIPEVRSAIVCGSANWGARVPEDLEEPGVTVLRRDLVFATPWSDGGEWKLVAIDGSSTPDGAPRQVLVVVIDDGLLESLNPIASRIAILAVARMEAETPCLCAGLRSPQAPRHGDRR